MNGSKDIRVTLWSFILLFSPSGWCAAPAQRAIFSAAVSYLFIMISVRTIISKSTRPSLVNFQGRQNVAVDDQCEMFFDLSRDVSMATNFVDFIHILRRCFFLWFYLQNWFAGRNVVSGAARRANAGFVRYLGFVFFVFNYVSVQYSEYIGDVIYLNMYTTTPSVKNKTLNFSPNVNRFSKFFHLQTQW